MCSLLVDCYHAVGHVFYSEHYNFPVYILSYFIFYVLMYMLVMYSGLHA